MENEDARLSHLIHLVALFRWEGRWHRVDHQYRSNKMHTLLYFNTDIIKYNLPLTILMTNPKRQHPAH
jgi:hypothetical protein